MENNELLNNIENIKTTELGIIRIKRNLDLETKNIVDYCKNKIKQSKSIYKRGKNWYISVKDIVITVNAKSYTIITAHKTKGR